MNATLFAMIAALIALVVAGILIWRISLYPSGNERMQEIARMIRSGAQEYLKLQYSRIALAAVILAALIGIFLNLTTMIGFIIGAVASAIAGFVGMNVSVRANVKTAEAAGSSLKWALAVAFNGGAVTGLLVVGLALLSLSAFYAITGDVKALVGLSFGGSLISMFARLGGGIFTKGADVGADLVGKIEAQIPEDDPRNPAVIADNVGDNVGDCAGMAADLFETYTVTATAAMLLGLFRFPSQPDAVLLPLLMGGISILASICGLFFLRLHESIMGAIYRGLLVSSGLALLGFWGLARIFSQRIDFLSLNQIFYPTVIGIAITLLIFVITDYYTSKRFRPVLSIAKSSEAGHGTNIITGLAVGMEATTLPILVIVAGILTAYGLSGYYGIGLAAMSMLSMAGIVVMIDAFGPIIDNAGGIAEMAGLPESTRKVTDALDAVGNTTKAVTKGYAIGSAGLGALVLLSCYIHALHDKMQAITPLSFDLAQPSVVAGLLLGGAIPYLFGAISMRAVGVAAGSIVKEVRRQFKEIPGLLEGEGQADYVKCVEIVTHAAIKEMVIPALLPIIAVVAVAFVLGPIALGGLLMGVIITGVFMAFSMTSGGAAWDNAKKYIEEGNLGGPGSDAHKAAVTGDTVGDPYKDTTGPAINPLIKVINVIAILLVPYL
jgi:K(+)-stimulated pyrophosphate-energized sodium pump